MLYYDETKKMTGRMKQKYPRGHAKIRGNLLTGKFAKIFLYILLTIMHFSTVNSTGGV
jgi:hypothetical protein